MSITMASAMIQWEEGELDYDSTIDLFQELVDTGLAWQLQGVYGRTALRLIREGVVQLRTGPAGFAMNPTNDD
jgi:hypothetical protein